MARLHHGFRGIYIPVRDLGRQATGLNSLQTWLGGTEAEGRNFLVSRIGDLYKPLNDRLLEVTSEPRRGSHEGLKGGNLYASATRKTARNSAGFDTIPVHGDGVVSADFSQLSRSDF